MRRHNSNFFLSLISLSLPNWPHLVLSSRGNTLSITRSEFNSPWWRSNTNQYWHTFETTILPGINLLYFVTKLVTKVITTLVTTNWSTSQVWMVTFHSSQNAFHPRVIFRNADIFTLFSDIFSVLKMTHLLYRHTARKWSNLPFHDKLVIYFTAPR